MKAIIFDHDGTLVDSEGTHHKIWQDLLDQWKVDFPIDDYIQNHAGVPTAKNAEILFNTNTIPLTNHETLYHLKEEATQNFLAERAFPLIPHVKEVLKHCKELGLLIGMATGASNYEVSTTLSRYALAPYFQSIATRDTVNNNKPAPDVYLRAANELQCLPEHCIAVEDSASGVKAAKAAGMYCIAIPNEYSANHDFSLADILLNDLVEAQEHIKELMCI